MRVEDSMIAVQTYLSPLDPIDLTDEEQNPSSDDADVDNEARVKVDIRKLSSVINLQNLPWDNASIYLSENAALLIEVRVGIGAVVRFHVPVIEINELE